VALSELVHVPQPEDENPSSDAEIVTTAGPLGNEANGVFSVLL
jgi:hypothetical protein